MDLTLNSALNKHKYSISSIKDITFSLRGSSAKYDFKKGVFNRISITNIIPLNEVHSKPTTNMLVVIPCGTAIEYNSIITKSTETPNTADSNSNDSTATRERRICVRDNAVTEMASNHIGYWNIQWNRLPSALRRILSSVIKLQTKCMSNMVSIVGEKWSFSVFVIDIEMEIESIQHAT